MKINVNKYAILVSLLFTYFDCHGQGEFPETCKIVFSVLLYNNH